MDDKERKERSIWLQELLHSEGGKILMRHLEDESKEGWIEFMDLPVEKKTSKAAYKAEARYKSYIEIKDWIDTEIKLGKI